MSLLFATVWYFPMGKMGLKMPARNWAALPR